MSAIQYAANWDIRSELNAGASEGDKGYKGEDQIHEALITRSALHATRDINGKLEKLYPTQVPYAASGDVPPLLRSIAEDLSVYYVRRAKHAGPAPMADGVKEEYYDNPMAMLDDIASGKMELNELNAAESYNDTFDANEDYLPTFDVDPVENQFEDEDRLDDIADSKL